MKQCLPILSTQIMEEITEKQTELLHENQQE